MEWNKFFQVKTNISSNENFKIIEFESNKDLLNEYKRIKECFDLNVYSYEILHSCVLLNTPLEENQMKNLLNQKGFIIIGDLIVLKFIVGAT